MSFYLYYITIIAWMLLADSFFAKTRNGIFLWVALLVIVLVSGLRYEIGYDWFNYVYFYESSWNLDVSLEPAFVWICRFFNGIGLPVQAGFIFFSAFIIFFVFKGCCYFSVNPRFSILIYLLIPGLYLNSFSIIRQSMAIALLFYGYKWLLDKQYWRYFGIVLFGAGIHLSCLFAVPFFILSQRLSDKIVRIAWLGLPLAIICSFLNVQQFLFSFLLSATKFAAYSVYDDGEKVSFIKLLVTNLIYLFYLSFHKMMNEQEKKILVLLFFATVFIDLFSSISFVTRISYYFRIFEIVMVVNVINKFRNGMSKIIMITCFFLYFLSLFINALSTDIRLEIYPKMTPYKSVFNINL